MKPNPFSFRSLGAADSFLYVAVDDSIEKIYSLAMGSNGSWFQRFILSISRLGRIEETF